MQTTLQSLVSCFVRKDSTSAWTDPKSPVCSPQVSQGNVPGVESASLAMDTEEGVEVVWNEVLFSDKKIFKAQEVHLLLFVLC